MRFLRIRITTRRMMSLIGVLGLCSALLRIHLSLASLAAGVMGLAFLRTCEKLDRARASGERTGVVRTIGIAIASGFLGLAMIMAGLVPMSCLLPVVEPRHNHSAGPDEGSLVWAILLVIAFGTPIAALLRQKLG